MEAIRSRFLQIHVCKCPTGRPPGLSPLHMEIMLVSKSPILINIEKAGGEEEILTVFNICWTENTSIFFSFSVEELRDSAPSLAPV